MLIQYTNAVYDEAAETWVFVAEVAEVPFIAFSSRKRAEKIAVRLVVRRIPELNPKATESQPTLLTRTVTPAFFTTVDAQVLGTTDTDKVYRRHAVIEQANADLKDSALAHLRSVISARIRPGGSQPLWPTTSPAPPGSLSRACSPMPGPARSGPNSSTSRPESLPASEKSDSTYPKHGPDKPLGDGSSPQPTHHRKQHKTHPTQPTPAPPKKPKRGTPMAARPAASPHPKTKPPAWIRNQTNPEGSSVEFRSVASGSCFVSIGRAWRPTSRRTTPLVDSRSVRRRSRTPCPEPSRGIVCRWGSIPEEGYRFRHRLKASKLAQGPGIR